MERPDQQTSKPSSLILRFLHQNIDAATIFPLKSSWMSFWSNLIYVLFPIFATNEFLKMTTISPGWDGGGGVSWSSLSRLRGRDPVSSGFPSPPFINHFVSLKFFSPVIWLYCCSGSLRNALLLDITKSWIWYRCDHHNPPTILIIISVFFSNITNIYVGDDYMISVSSFPISPTNGSPGPVRCLIREILVGSLIKPGLGTFTLDLSGHKSWDRGKYEFTNLHIWSILKTHWNVVWFLFEGNLADPDFVNQTLVWLYSDYQIKTEVRRCTNLLMTMLHLIDVSGICISAETHWEHGRAGSQQRSCRQRSHAVEVDYIIVMTIEVDWILVIIDVDAYWCLIVDYIIWGLKLASMIIMMMVCCWDVLKLVSLFLFEIQLNQGHATQKPRTVKDADFNWILFFILGLDKNK